MFQEGSPKFRIIGTASDSIKRKAGQEMTNLLTKQGIDDLPNDWREIIKESEFPKTQEELLLIDLSNQKTNELMKATGVPGFNVPADNFRILPASSYEKVAQEKGNAGATALAFQMVALNADEIRKNIMVFGCTVFHEMMHLKSHFTLQVEIDNEDEGVIKTPYREGLIIKPPQNIIAQNKYHEHFCGLNDALVASLEKDFVQELLKMSFVQKEQSDLQDPEVAKIKKQASLVSGVPEEEIVWMSRDGQDGMVISYQPQREVLNFVVNEIQKELLNQYPSTKQVFMEFLKAFFTGQISSIARLVEKTFGKGSFEVLGMMGDDDQTPIQVLEYLKRARARESTHS